TSSNLVRPTTKTQRRMVLKMPKQIYDIDKFLEMSEEADECRVKRGSNQVKLKLRTKKYLYTIVVEPQKAEEIIQQVKCQVVEARSGEKAA
ncbi:MAG: hypothetical protein ACFFDM_05585, partial [Candidatus Thorarchaeota archaeon]